MSSFPQLVGAAGDVRELEYVSALFQTDQREVRTDASICAEDIRLFLSSRYGIAVTEDQVCSRILRGLISSSSDSSEDDDDDDMVDLMELVALLLLPTIQKAAQHLVCSQQDDTDDDEHCQGEVVPAPKEMLNYVLKMILHDVTGSSQPKRLTPELVQKILIAYGENDLAEETQLVQEMVNVATTTSIGSSNQDAPKNTTTKGNVMDVTETSATHLMDASCEHDTAPSTEEFLLSEKIFAQALTYDIQLYDVRNETRVTTNMEDVFGPNGDTEAVIINDNPPPRQEGEVMYKDEYSSSNDQKKKALQALEQPPETLKRKMTFPSIDVTAGTYRSKSLVIVVWSAFIITYFAYTYSAGRQYDPKCTGEKQFVYSYTAPWRENKEAMFCEMSYSILGWLDEFWSMCWNGVLYVGLASIGNSIHCKRFWLPLMGAVYLTGLTTLHFLMAPKDQEERWILYIAAIALGATGALLHLSHVITILVSPQRLQSCCPSLYRIIQGTVVSEQKSKQAAAVKVAKLVSNALEIVAAKDPQESVLRTHYGQALTNYARNGKKHVDAGGFVWAWQRMMRISGATFAKDGIWINSRILAGNIGQYVVVVYTLLGGITLTEQVIANFDDEWAKQQFRSFAERTFTLADQDEVTTALVSNVSTLVSGFLAQGSTADTLLSDGCSGMRNDTAAVEDILDMYCNNNNNRLVDGALNLSGSSGAQLYCDPDAPVNYLCPLLDASVAGTLNVTSQQALLGGSGFDADLLEQVVRDAVYQSADDSVDSLYPAEKYMLMVPMIAGVAVAFLTCAYLALCYIPSVATTILKLRCGHIATLRDPEFLKYRQAPDQVCMLTGSIFWGTLVSGVVVGGTVGLVIFFFLWQATAYFAQRLLAIVIGIIAVTLFRLLLVSICRCTLYKSFYRERPGIANILFLALEWAVFALSVGFIFARMIKLMLAAGMSIGRIDTPFLAPGVGRIGALELDGYPMIHLKDVLSHEAHRHPYIEQIGVVYLMKLRHGSRFGQRAGTCWRLIFVHALLPWLHKYRVMTRSRQLSIEDSDEDGEEDEKRKPSFDYPSLNFKSLRNFEAESGNDDGNEHPLHVVAMTTTAPHALFGASATEDDKGKNDVGAQAKRIQQLEAENRALKEALAKAALSGSFEC
ncbi:unknown protein [Seminavis robusta]|uniref:Uncharacterized protein n=1 Tax=Seminavis robusta TaxID=568900 RepID=A0A9N8HNM4_9STRA|nr:unknown protein [Seminavis robusta]|eukprot:Sro1230_g254550.1 n/a (1143) ;mRNA; f:19514-23359